MKFYKRDICTQEVPNELCLTYYITGCPLRCEKCHSPFLWSKNKGTKLDIDLFCQDLIKYNGYITCVLFMGGEWHEAELIILLKAAITDNLKTCLYTGQDDVSESIKNNLTYLKTGPYIEQLGGLASEISNQKLIEISSNKKLNHFFINKNYNYDSSY